MPDETTAASKPICPIHGDECLQRDQIVSIEAELKKLRQKLVSVDQVGSLALARALDKIHSDQRGRAYQLDEMAQGMRTLTAWAPTIDGQFESLRVRQGELAGKVEDLSDEVRELQGIVKDGNGRTREK